MMRADWAQDRSVGTLAADSHGKDQPGPHSWASYALNGSDPHLNIQAVRNDPQAAQGGVAKGASTSTEGVLEWSFGKGAGQLPVKKMLGWALDGWEEHLAQKLERWNNEMNWEERFGEQWSGEDDTHMLTLSAAAQALRYGWGANVQAKYQPGKGHFGFAGKARTDVSVAEGSFSGTFYLPHDEGGELHIGVPVVPLPVIWDDATLAEKKRTDGSTFPLPFPGPGSKRKSERRS